MKPFDDPSIENDDTVIRRINPEQHVVPDDNLGGYRLSTKAFSASSELNGGMSVDIPKLMESDGVDAATFVEDPPYTAAVSFAAGAAREVSLWVGCEPLPSNPYHAEVWKQPDGGRFTKSQQRALLNASDWFIEIQGVSIPKSGN